MSERLNQSLVIGTALILFGVGAVAASLNIDLEFDGSWGPRIFPLVGAVSLSALGGLELLNGLRVSPIAPARAKTKPAHNANTSIVMLLALALAYVWLISKLGYLVSTGLVAPAGMYLFGIRNPFGLVAAAILCPAIYHLLFFIGLGVFPPFGEWFDLLDLVQGY